MVIINRGQKTNARGIAIPRFLAKELMHFKNYKETIDNDFSQYVFSKNGRQLTKNNLLPLLKP